MIADVAARAGHDLGVAAGPMASRQLFEAVPFYEGLTLDLIGAGVRWPAHESAAKFPQLVPVGAGHAEDPRGPARRGPRRARCASGPIRSLWSSKEVDVSPALMFLRPQQVVELSPRDAERLGVGEGDHVELGAMARASAARCACAMRSRAARCSSSEGTPDQPSNVLTDPTRADRSRRRPRPATGRRRGPGHAAVEGRAEAPPSAPLEIPPTDGHSGHGV